MTGWVERMYRREWVYAGLLVVVVALLGHGLLIPRLGLYVDDWYFGWVAHSGGADGLIDDMALDRPLGGYLYAGLYAVLGERPVAWHSYTLAMRIVGALALLWGLRAVWPGQRLATTAAALLFVVYPGFLSQTWGLVFSFVMTALALGMVSVGASLRAWTETRPARRAALIALAVSSGAAYLGLAVDYFIGLEVLRVLLLYVLVVPRETGLRRRIVRAGRRWLPYALVALAVLGWRLVIFNDDVRSLTDFSAVLDRYRAAPAEMARRLTLELMRDFVESVVLGWFATANGRLTSTPVLGEPRRIALAFGIGGLAGALTLLYAWGLRRSGHEKESAVSNDAGQVWGRTALLIGAAAVWAAMFPILFALREVILLNPSDRYTLPLFAGIGLTVTGAIWFLVRPGWRVWPVTGLVVLSVATLFANADGHRVDWERQRHLWWQMIWRAPNLAQDTLLLIDAPPGIALWDVWTIGNGAAMLYGYQTRTQHVWASNLSEGIEYSLERGQRSSGFLRSTEIVVDFSKPLVLMMPSARSCVHVVDAARLYELPPGASALVRSVGRYSRIDLIRLDAVPVVPPGHIFGSEPAHSWCYYFQKAELARQRADWDEVVRLGDEARARGLGPDYAYRVEWLSFVEGYAAVGRCEEARGLVEQVIETLPGQPEAATFLPVMCRNEAE